MIDNLFQKCKKCNNSEYQEIDIWGDNLECLHCNDKVNRYEKEEIDFTLDKKFQEGFNLGVQQAKEEILDSLKHFISDMKIENE